LINLNYYIKCYKNNLIKPVCKALVFEKLLDIFCIKRFSEGESKRLEKIFSNKARKFMEAE